MAHCVCLGVHSGMRIGGDANWVYELSEIHGKDLSSKGEHLFRPVVRRDASKELSRSGSSVKRLKIKEREIFILQN